MFHLAPGAPDTSETLADGPEGHLRAEQAFFAVPGGEFREEHFVLDGLELGG